MTSEPEDARNPATINGAVSGGLGRAIAYIAVGGYYDHQKLRTMHMNRVRDVLRKINEGISLTVPEPKQANKTFAKKYADKNLPVILTSMRDTGKLNMDETTHILHLLTIAKEEKKFEGQYVPIVEAFASQDKIYSKLRQTRGIGPVLAGAVVAWFDPAKAPHPSSFWKYAGLDVQNGKAPKLTRGLKTTWNPKVRTLCWKIADSMIKQRTPIYRQIYDLTKAEEQAKLKGAGKGWKLHAELRAKRKMIKRFLSDLWVEWRKLEGLPLSEPYAIAILGHDKQERDSAGEAEKKLNPLF